MATTGPIFPSAAQSISEAPWSDNAWNTGTEANIFSDDGVTAVVNAASYDANDQTFVLKAYTFDFSSIPDGSTINGVICVVNAFWSAGGASIDLLQLLNTARVKVGTNQCSTAVALTNNTANLVTKGSSTDLWGNALDVAWVKDADFGVAIGILATAANTDVEVDYVTLEIFYTPPSIVDQTNTSRARVQKIIDQTLQSLARVQKIIDQTSPAQARIQKVIDQTLTSVANISAPSGIDKFQTSVSRIQKVIDQTLSSQSRIQVLQNQTINSKGRVQKVADEIIQAIARVQKIFDTTITSTGRIQSLVTQTITSQTRITGFTTQTITARARIGTVSNPRSHRGVTIGIRIRI